MGRNIRLYYFFRALSCAHMFKPFTYFYCRSRGLSVLEFMLLYTIFSAAVILLEVPTGAWADRLGRRKSMAVGAGLMGFASLGYMAAYGFGAFAICEFVFAVGLTLTSGADSAFLYDTLKQGGREEDYRRMEGQGSSAKHVGLMLAALIGGFLAMLDLRLPYIATAVVCFAAVGVALGMSERRIWTRAPREPDGGGGEGPSEGNVGANEGSVQPAGFDGAAGPVAVGAYGFRQALDFRWRALRRYMVEAVRTISKKPALLWAIFYSTMIFVIIRMSDALYQPVLKKQGFGFLAMGAVFAVLNLMGAISARSINSITKRFSEKLVLWALPVILIVSYMLLDALGPVMCVMLMLAQYSVTGAYSPFTKSLINHEIDSSHVRATVLSAESATKRLAVAAVSPFLGWLISSVSLRAGLYACAGCALLGTITVLMVVRRHGMQRRGSGDDGRGGGGGRRKPNADVEDRSRDEGPVPLPQPGVAARSAAAPWSAAAEIVSLRAQRAAGRPLPVEEPAAGTELSGEVKSSAHLERFSA